MQDSYGPIFPAAAHEQSLPGDALSHGGRFLRVTLRANTNISLEKPQSSTKLCLFLQDGGPPITPLPEQALPGETPVHGGGILQVEFAADAGRLLTGSTDRTARCLWLPVSKHAGAGTTFVGHNGPINSVSWSHDGEYLLTASSDRWGGV